MLMMMFLLILKFKAMTVDDDYGGVCALSLYSGQLTFPNLRSADLTENVNFIWTCG